MTLLMRFRRFRSMSFVFWPGIGKRGRAMINCLLKPTRTAGPGARGLLSADADRERRGQAPSG